MTILDRSLWHGFIVTPNDHVTMIEAGGDGESLFIAPGLFVEMVAAGYPICDEPFGHQDRFVDVGVDPTDPTDAVAYTIGAEPREHMLGDKAEVFLRWYRSNVAEETR